MQDQAAAIWLSIAPVIAMVGLFALLLVAVSFDWMLDKIDDALKLRAARKSSS